MSPKRCSPTTTPSPGLQLRKADDIAARPVNVPARAVVLATGGIGHLYAVTTNPKEASGLGLAIAARAGAIIGDPEFVQFHPTAIMVGRDPAPLATEALRGEGATLINAQGRALHAGEASAGRARAARHRRPRRVRRDRRRPRRVPRCDEGAGRQVRRAFPDRLCKLHRRRHRSGAPADPDRAGRALPHGRRRGGRARPHLDRRPVGRRRSLLHRRAWRQPPRLQLAARGRGLCRAHRRGHRRPRLRGAAPAAGRCAAQLRHAAVGGSEPARADGLACRRDPRRRRPCRRHPHAGDDGSSRSATSRCATWRRRR